MFEESPATCAQWMPLAAGGTSVKNGGAPASGAAETRLKTAAAEPPSRPKNRRRPKPYLIEPRAPRRLPALSSAWRRSPFAARLPARPLPGCPCVHRRGRADEHTSELQSPCNLVCRLLLEKDRTTL